MDQPQHVERVFLELRLERLACGRSGDRHRSAILSPSTTAHSAAVNPDPFPSKQRPRVRDRADVLV
jgi:hypothetical protein